VRSFRSTAKKPRKSRVRALDALAVAERQNPTRAKIQRNRLGEVDGDEKRKRRDGVEPQGEDDVGLEYPPPKRRKTQASNTQGAYSSEEGSDSDGNHWRLGAVDSEDDSELDSDEAMGVSDTERYKDYAFSGSSTSRLRGKGSRSKGGMEDKVVKITDIDLSEGDGEHGDFSEGDDLGDETVDLATALDMNKEEEADYAGEQAAANSKIRTDSADDEDHFGEDASEAEEDSENSDLSLSDEEDVDKELKSLANLQDFITSVHNNPAKVSQVRPPYSNTQEQSLPSEYGVAPIQKLTVADLISTVTDPRLKHSLKLLNSAEKPGTPQPRGGIPGKLAAPLPKRLQGRLDRTAAYQKSKETLDRWIDTVKQNRRAEHLSFPLIDWDTLASQGTNRLLSTSSSEPLNDLEGAIQAILQESGLQSRHGADEEARVQAFEDLQSNKLPMEEVQARRTELRRARDLLFREEVRAKRIKKIKSKSYRRVHRKARQRADKQEREALAAAGVQLSEEEQELNDRRRAEERMGARHRASRWAKGIKETGRATWDDDAREGVTEMARKGEELRKRIEGKRANDPDDYLEPSTSESDDEISDLEPLEGARRSKRERQLERLEGTARSATKSDIMSMRFMKNAEAARKAANDAGVEHLRREIHRQESPVEDEAEEIGRRNFGYRTVPHQKPVSNPKTSEFEEELTSSDEEGITTVKENVDKVADPSRPTLHRSPTLKDRTSHVVRETEALKDCEMNPWLAKAGQAIKKRESAPVSNGDPIIITNPDPAFNRPKSSNKMRKAAACTATHSPLRHESSSSSEPPFSTSGSLHRNAELVKAAFAGDDVFTSFGAEKASLAASEDEKEVSSILPGWGSWTGEGISKKQLKRQQSHLSNKKNLIKIDGIKPSDRKDANLANVAISEKRVRKNGKYLASQLPHPFESQAQYERSLRVPVGPEWTTKETFQRGTKPRVMVKKGIVVGPMDQPLL
jgi:U3 small nucleolar RNA-associated protein 14